MILRFVSRRHFFPFSTRSIVNVEIPAFLASSTLLNKSLSRYFLSEFICVSKACIRRIDNPYELETQIFGMQK